MESRIINNPDKEEYRRLKKLIKSNGGYCLCASDRSPDTKCVCKKFQEQRVGMCDCGLYIKYPV